MPATPDSSSPTPENPVLKVGFNVPLWGVFDYRPADGSPVDAQSIGKRVRAPFGKGGKEKFGVVVGIGPATVSAPAPAELLDSTPLLTGELLDSLRWLHRYTHAPLGETLWQALPKTLRDGGSSIPNLGEEITVTDNGRNALTSMRAGKPRAALEWLIANAPVPLSALGPEVGAAAMRTLVERGLVERRPIAPDTLRLHLDAVTRAWTQMPSHALHSVELNDAQTAAVETIADGLGSFGVSVLQGVTGSGKTEVYLQLIARAIAQGQQALVLVPEIGLTPQTLARFESRLGVPVDALHSGLSDNARADVWLRARAGLSRVIVGTRSAAFLPFEHLGLIVIDEEHDTSFKQFDGIRYNARDFLVQRAHRLNVPIVLGSATPSLETMHNANIGKYARVRLPARAGAAVPPVLRTVDVRGQVLQAGLSLTTLEAIDACVARGEQVLVFKNRRGYAPVLLCHDCGWTAKCDRCDASMTVHHGGRRLQCHHCGLSRPTPNACPDCSGLALQPQGVGTERIEEFLTARLGDSVPVVRIDRSTTATRDGLQKQLALLGSEAGVLIGTQMLAKGHDLPNLTLVVVVGADEGLFSTDFRSHERLVQLMIQVAGRAGRASKPGTVRIQTHHPEHPLFAWILAQDYEGFTATELSERSAASWPPFASLALIRAESQNAAHVRAFLTAARDQFRPYTDVMAMGPLPAPMPRRAGYLREQLLLQTLGRAELHTALSAVVPQLYALPEARRVRWSLDVDPYDLY